MKVRTLTLGLPGFPDSSALGAAADILGRVRSAVASAGVEVQTVRVALSGGGLPGVGDLQALERNAIDNGIDFVALGPVTDPADIRALGPLLATTSRICAHAPVTDGSGLLPEAVEAAVETILHLSAGTPGGLGNFGFAAASLVPAGVPFFPVAAHDGATPVLAVGLENSDLFVEACRRAGHVDALAGSMGEVLMEHLPRLEDVVSGALDGVRWGGIDTSIASSLAPDESVARGFEALGCRFGGAGTLAVAAATTAALKSVPVTRTGYCGLMLPVLEDAGLMELADDGAYGVEALLAASAVCGVGIDTVPVPGNADPRELGRLVRDVAALSLKWSKPLACRVLPVPGKEAGERTDWDFPHMGNCRIFAL